MSEVLVKLPRGYAKDVGESGEVRCSGNTVSEALEDLCVRHESLKKDDILKYMTIFVNRALVLRSDYDKCSVSDGDEILLLVPSSGG